MILFVSGATVDVRRHPECGVLVRPDGGYPLDLLHARLWGVDNAAFTGFDADKFVTMLGRVRGIPGCQFVACPDVVGDCVETERRFALWAPMIAALGFPIALVAQDGLTPTAVPWDSIDALFIGGTTAFKLSREAERLLGAAFARGKWRHVGRVNSRRRIRHFLDLTDSIDGSGFSKYGKRIKKALGWIDEVRNTPTLDGHVVREP